MTTSTADSIVGLAKHIVEEGVGEYTPDALFDTALEAIAEQYDIKNVEEFKSMANYEINECIASCQ